ncbi:thermonuclease family protein (plasmid) [Falsihalocynthiibacter sp. SS001]|uniref:thermonuclease family protein n=1 Tax=Falsihalocynthiibacter sp. SS001 TaxID=3349698 RepID=UPI0036D21E4E
MLKVTKVRRRKKGFPFILPIIGCAILLWAITMRPDGQSAARQDANTPNILNGGGAWTGGSAWKGNHRVKQTTAVLPGAQLVDTVTRIRDGDTIVVGLVPIRIANLDCAERGSNTGDRATRQITEIVKDVQLRCTLEGRRSYDREVGVCSLSDGRDVGELLITGGYCQRWQG